MSLSDFKHFVKNKRNTALAVVALSAHMSFAQNQQTSEDRKENKTEQVAEKTQEFTIGKEVHDGEEFATINGNIVLGNTDSNLRKDLKEYKKEQKQQFRSAEKDTWNTVDLETYLQSDMIVAAEYDDSNKNVNYNLFKLGSKEEIAQKLREENPDLSVERANQVAEQYFNSAQSLNNSETPTFLGLSAHENQHKNNDGDNIYAPGLNAEQYGKLYQYDEMTANIANLLVLDHQIQESLKNGMTKDDALKLFDENANHQFSFYKKAVENGLEPGSEESTKLIVNGTCEMWTKTFQDTYSDLTKAKIDMALATNDVGSLAMGNDKEYQRRKEKMFDNLEQNPVLKELGIKRGKLSQYLTEKDVSLSPELKTYCEEQTLTYTGLTPRQGKILSDKMPGSPKKDAVNLINLLRGNKVSRKISKIFESQNTQNLNKAIIPNQKQAGGR